MADREKVIKGLECLADRVSGCQSDCPYYASRVVTCFRVMAADALELLKEQETTEYGYDEYICPACKKCGFRPFAGYIPTLKWMQQRGYNYCPGCGKKVKWE